MGKCSLPGQATKMEAIGCGQGLEGVGSNRCQLPSLLPTPSPFPRRPQVVLQCKRGQTWAQFYISCHWVAAILEPDHHHRSKGNPFQHQYHTSLCYNIRRQWQRCGWFLWPSTGRQRTSTEENILMVQSNWNARIENACRNWKGKCRKFCNSETNDRGLQLLEFANCNNLLVALLDITNHQGGVHGTAVTSNITTGIITSWWRCASSQV